MGDYNRKIGRHLDEASGRCSSEARRADRGGTENGVREVDHGWPPAERAGCEFALARGSNEERAVGGWRAMESWAETHV